jgi:hypothetical protein
MSSWRHHAAEAQGNARRFRGLFRETRRDRNSLLIKPMKV